MPNFKISQFPINTNPSGENLLAVVASGVTMALPLSGVSSFTLPNGDIHVTGGTYSNGVTTFTNSSGGTFLVAGFLTVSVSASSINYVISTADTNTYFTNEGAVTGIIFTLPTAVKNMKYSFLLQNSNQVTVQAAAGNTIRIGLDVTSSGGTISAFDAGSSITLIAINSTEWLSLNQPAGSWLI